MEPSFSTKLITFLSGFSGLTAYSAILGVLFICGLGVPIPEDITLIAAGILAGIGNISLAGALICGFIGVMVGDTFLYLLGRKLGDRAFTLPLINKIMTPKRIILAKEKVKNHSHIICFTARFLPGLRSPTFLTAGVMGIRPAVFFGLDGAAALISVPIWVVGGWWFGANIDQAIAFAHELHMYLIAFLIIVGVSYYVVKIRKKKSSSPA